MTNHKLFGMACIGVAKFVISMVIFVCVNLLLLKRSA